MKNLVFAGLALACLTTAALVPSAAVAEEARPQPAGGATRFARIAHGDDGRPAALQLAIVSYREARSDTRVDLLSAVHIGDRAYYHELNRRFRDYDVLLYEMIVPDQPDDSEKAGPSLISRVQIGLKSLLGLAFQLDEIDYEAPNFVHADLSSGALAQSMAEREESLYVYFWRLVYAALDNYAGDPLGLTDLGRMADLAGASGSDALKISFAWEVVDASAGRDILGGQGGSAIIAARNARALDVLKERMAAGALRIGIFYGVAHMPDFEQRLESEFGLAKAEIEWIDAWRFGNDTDCDNGGSDTCMDPG